MEELVSVNVGERHTYDAAFATAGRTGDGHVLVVLSPHDCADPDDMTFFAMKPETALVLLAALKRACAEVCGEVN